MDDSLEKMDPNLKLLQKLIDECIEEEDFDEAFFLFIKFGKHLDNKSCNYLFDRYYKLLKCDKKN